MKRPTRNLFPLLLAFVAMLFTLPACSAKDTHTTEEEQPPVIQNLQQRGLKIQGQFEAPGGLDGYAAETRGRPMAIYVTEDGKHAVVGTMIDASGNNLSAEPLRRLVVAPKHKGMWKKLENSTWIADGSKDAGRVIYMFFDANCPYCHKFWAMARPWVKAGKVRIRHIPVGLLKPSSLPKAAAILAADDPSAALTRNERSYDKGGIGAMKDVPEELAEKIKANTRMMKSLGFHATPTVVYRDKDDEVRVIQGVPKPRGLTRVMGSSKP